MARETLQDVEAVDLQAASNRLQTELRNAGYTVKAGSFPDEYDSHRKHELRNTGLRWSASHDQRGVKVSATFYNIHDGTFAAIIGKTLEISVRTRTHRDTYRKGLHNRFTVRVGSEVYGGRHDHNRWLDNIAKALAATNGETVTAPIIRSKSALADFPPFRFDRPTYAIDATLAKGRKTVVMKAFFRDCVVHGAASILPSLKVSLAEVATPGAEPWFYVKGDIWAKRSGAVGELVVSMTDDGMVYYPVRNGKITNIMRPENTYLDFEQVSEIDEEIIRRAIEEFLG